MLTLSEFSLYTQGGFFGIFLVNLIRDCYLLVHRLHILDCACIDRCRH
jgi:hypothetical protein